MTENELKALNVNDTAIIEKIPEGAWVFWNESYLCGARFPAKSRNAALKMAQDNKANLIVEKTPAGF